MATTVSSYPKIGATAWRTLRARAATAPSSKFTPAAVAVLLGHDSQASAATNVVYPMQKFGLIGEDGNLTDRGHKWRSADGYAEACQEILDEIYPADLAGFTASNGSPDRSMVTRWFQQQKFGDSNAKQMAATYVMIAEKKVPDPPSDKDVKGKAKKQTPSTAVKPANSTAKPTAPSAHEDAGTRQTPPLLTPPSVVRPDIHLDFQIHIAADAKPEVVDQIFASMAKHLYPTA
jgi:hypothetical protein